MLSKHELRDKDDLRGKIQERVPSETTHQLTSIPCSVILPALIETQTQEDALSYEKDRPVIRDPRAVLRVTVNAYKQTWGGVVSSYRSGSVINVIL